MQLKLNVCLLQVCRQAIVVIAVQPNHLQKNVCINSCFTIIAPAYVNQAKIKCLADILLRLNIIFRQIAFLFNLLMRSRL
jgi:hypothetical protein